MGFAELAWTWFAFTEHHEPAGTGKQYFSFLNTILIEDVPHCIDAVQLPVRLIGDVLIYRGIVGKGQQYDESRPFA